jgi:DamX protein
MNAIDEPEYVVGLRLKRAPFDTDCSDAFFFADPPLNDWLEELRDRTEAGGTILLIEDVAGSGRTTVLRQLVRRMGEAWTVCRMQGADLFEPAAALRKMAHQYGLDETAQPEQLWRLIAAYCRVSPQLSQLPVLMIDDADRIPATVLQQLLCLCGSPAETVRYLRIVLCGLPGLHDSLVKAGVAEGDPSRMQRLTVPPLQRAHTEAYLMYRLSVAGYTGPSPFSAPELHAIQDRAAGLRGRINQLAHQALLEHVWVAPRRNAGGTKSAEERPLRPGGLSGPLRWVGAGGVALLVAGVFWWTLSPPSGERSSTEIATREFSLPLPELGSAPEEVADTGRTPSSRWPAPGSPGTTVATAPGHEEKTGDSAEIPLLLPDAPGAAIAALETGEAPPANAPASLSDLVVPDAGVESSPAQNGALAVAPVESVHRDTRDAEPSAAAISEAAVATVAPVEGAQQDTGKGEQPAVASSAEVANTRPEADTSGLYREDWLRRQPPEAVTLQLIALSQEASVHRFVKDQPLPEPTAYFHRTRKGKDLYIVFYGVFSDSAAAKAAISTLPKAMRQGSPLPRTFASIQKDIPAGELH